MSHDNKARSSRQFSADWFQQLKHSLHGNYPGVLCCYGIPESLLTKRHTACPVCGGRDRFRFDNLNGSGSWYCNQCGSGDGLKLLHKFSGKPYSQLYRELVLNSPYIQYERPTHSSLDLFGDIESDYQKKKKIERLRRICEEAVPLVEDCAAAKYLRNRGWSGDFPDFVHFHPGVRYYHDHERYEILPAMLAQLINLNVKCVSVHQTFLTVEGKKAAVPNPKKLMSPPVPGATKGAAIQLFQAGSELVVAEGIETALAVAQASGLPAWAAVSAGGLESLEIPELVSRVYIAVDNDFSGRGQQAARVLAQRLYEGGIKTKLLIPDTIGQDWADVLAV
jgi:putative DNA primase/helicase